MEQEGENMEGVEGGKVYDCGEEKTERVHTHGLVLKRLQREGVQRFFDAHARGLKRRIREGDSMGFYAHFKGE